MQTPQKGQIIFVTKSSCSPTAKITEHNNSVPRRPALKKATKQGETAK